VATLLSVGFVGYYFGSLGAYVGDVTEVWVQPPFHEASYVVGVYNSTYYYAKNSTDGKYVTVNSNARTTIHSVLKNNTKIVLGAGTFVLDKPIGYEWGHSENAIKADNVELCGLGVNTTTLKLADTQETYDALIFLRNWTTAQGYTTNWNIHDMTLDGNKAGQGDVRQWGIRLDFVKDSKISNVAIINIASGTGDPSDGGRNFEIHDCQNIEIQNCYAENELSFIGNGRLCVLVESSKSVNIDHLTTYGGSGAVNLYEGAEDCVVSNCHFYNFTRGAMTCYKDACNNVFANNVAVGDNWTDANLMGGYMGHGDYPNNPSIGNTLIGNVIEEVYIGYCVSGNSTGNKISGNTFGPHVKKGIYLPAKSNNTLVEGNVFNGLDIYGLEISGYYNVIHGNTFQSYVPAEQYFTGVCLYGDNNTLTDNSFFDMNNAFILIQSEGNLFKDNYGYNCSRLAYISDAQCTYNQFYYNKAEDIRTVFVTDYGSNNDFRWNIGYVTENSGSQVNGTATTWTIAHGLVSTPIFASFSFNATGWTSYKWSADGTNITVTITGTPETAAVLCYWDARTWN